MCSQLVGAVDQVAAAVGVAEHRVRAPPALVGAAARGDQVDAAHAVVGAPGVDVPLQVDGRAVGPGQAVDVGDLRRAAVVDHRARPRRGRPCRRRRAAGAAPGWPARAAARPASPRPRRPPPRRRRGPGTPRDSWRSRARPAPPSSHAALASATIAEHVRPRDQVGVDSEHAARAARQPIVQLLLAAPGAVVRSRHRSPRGADRPRCRAAPAAR